MRRKIASSADFHAASFQVSRLIGDNRPNGVRIGLFPSEMNSQPVILPAGIVAEKEWRAIIDGNQNVNRPVVIEITQSHAPCRQGSRKDGATLIADILKIIARIAKKQHAFTVRNTRHAPVDTIIRVAVAE